VLAEAKPSQLSTWKLRGFLLFLALSRKKYEKKKKNSQDFQ